MNILFELTTRANDQEVCKRIEISDFTTREPNPSLKSDNHFEEVRALITAINEAINK